MGTPSSTSTRPPPRETSTWGAWASSAEPATASPSPTPLTCMTAPLTSSPDPALTLPNLTSLAALLSLCSSKRPNGCLETLNLQQKYVLCTVINRQISV